MKYKINTIITADTLVTVTSVRKVKRAWPQVMEDLEIRKLCWKSFGLWLFIWIYTSAFFRKKKQTCIFLSLICHIPKRVKYLLTCHICLKQIP